MARKGKGFNIKRLFVDHGEKMVFAGVLGLVVLALAGTTWVPYDKQPSQFTERVEKAVQAIAVTTWPETDREQFEITEETSPRRIVDEQINDRIAVTPQYQHSQTQLKNKDARDDPLQEPEFLPVVALIATDARVNIRQQPDEDLLASAEGLNPDGTPIDPNNPGSAAAEDERPDEFRQPTGGFGGAYGGGDEMLAGRGMMMGRGNDRDYGSMFAPELQRGRGAGARGGAGGGGRGGVGRSVGVADVDGAPAVGRGRGRGNAARGGATQGGPARGGTARGGAIRGGRGEVGGGGARGALAGMGFAGGDEDFGFGYGGGFELEGKGYPFVSVRGVFEFREQIRKYSEAIHKGRSEALLQFMIIDFQLERQRLQSAPDTWTAWEKVNDQVFRDILNKADGFAPEVVSGAVTDSAITCPLPARLYGEYRTQATHPRLEKFTLSDEDMELELKYSGVLLSKALEQKKLPAGVIRKRGFNDMVFDSRSIQSSMFGFQSPYGMGDMGDETMPIVRGPADRDGGGRGGMAMGRAGVGGLRGNAMMNNKTIEQLVQELAAESDVDPKDPKVQEKLKKFIETRVAPEGDLLLFRYFDFDIEPGETYRYRVRLELQNPNHGQALAATGGDASVIAGETRFTPWSEPTPAVRVDETVKYFLTTVQPPRAAVYPDARLNVFQYDQDVGTVVQQELEVAFGQKVGGKAKVEQANPAKKTFEPVDYTFKSDDILLDAIQDVRLSKTEHPDLALPADSRGLAQITEVAAVVTRRGQIKTIDPVTQADALATAKKNKGYQDEMFEIYREVSATGAGAGYESLYGDMGGDEFDASMIKTTGRNPLRKGRGGAGRGGGGGGRN